MWGQSKAWRAQYAAPVDSVEAIWGPVLVSDRLAYASNHLMVDRYTSHLDR